MAEDEIKQVAFKKIKHAGGRPPKITKEVVEKIIQAVLWGNYLETAASYAGISKGTLYLWLKKGNTYKTGIYKEFIDSVQKAMAEAEMRDVKNITESAASGQWTASAWRLERKFPDRWGRKDKHQITGDIKIVIDKEDEEL